jgi:hypothetical protein
MRVGAEWIFSKRNFVGGAREPGRIGIGDITAEPRKRCLILDHDCVGTRIANRRLRSADTRHERARSA